jgi:hypothetical protein
LQKYLERIRELFLTHKVVEEPQERNQQKAFYDTLCKDEICLTNYFDYQVEMRP